MNLSTPLPASNDCLPHAAMNLGSAQGLGIRPAALVSRLVIEEQYGNFVLYRMDAAGGFVGDTWHGSIEDAVWQVKKEFGVEFPPLAGSRESLAPPGKRLADARVEAATPPERNPGDA